MNHWTTEPAQCMVTLCFVVINKSFQLPFRWRRKKNNNNRWREREEKYTGNENKHKTNFDVNFKEAILFSSVVVNEANTFIGSNINMNDRRNCAKRIDNRWICILCGGCCCCQFFHGSSAAEHFLNMQFRSIFTLSLYSLRSWFNQNKSHEKASTSVDSLTDTQTHTNAERLFDHSKYCKIVNGTATALLPIR